MCSFSLTVISNERDSFLPSVGLGMAPSFTYLCPYRLWPALCCLWLLSPPHWGSAGPCHTLRAQACCCGQGPALVRCSHYSNFFLQKFRNLKPLFVLGPLHVVTKSPGPPSFCLHRAAPRVRRHLAFVLGASSRAVGTCKLSLVRKADTRTVRAKQGGRAASQIQCVFKIWGLCVA